MSQSGFTPIQLFRTSTAAAVPTAGSLAAGELAINLTDERLYFKNAAGTVKLLASTDTLGTVTSVAVSGGTTGLTTSGGPITTSGTITLAGTLGVANGGTGTATAFTTGSVVFAGASGVYTQDNANFFWDDTNNRLGIGTSSPSFKLDVSGTLRSTGVATLGTGATTTIATIGDSSTTNTRIIQFGRASAVTDIVNIQGINAGVGAADISLQASGGNVGIGTSSPATKLDVNGDATFRNGSGVIIGTVANSSGWYDFAGSANVNGAQISTPITTPVRFLTNATERMRIDGSGNVGIGTSSPGLPLNVSKNGTDSGLGYSNVSKFTDGSGNKGLLVGYDNSAQTTVLTANSTSASSNMAFWTYEVGGSGWAERMRITSAGDIGIGTSSPVSKLHVNSASGATYATVGNGNGGTQLGVDAAGLSVLSAYAANVLRFGNNSVGTFAETMRIDSSGNVGIGTSSPGAKLDVTGAIKATGTGATVSANAAVIDYVAASTSRFISYGPNTTTPGAFQFVGLSSNASAGDIRAVIDSSGNVGIGASSPSSYAVSSDRTLVIAGSAFASLNLVCGGAFGGAGLTVDSSANLLFRNAGTERMRIDSSGNLLVGTTTSSNTTTLNKNGLRVPNNAAITVGTSATQISVNAVSWGSIAFVFGVDGGNAFSDLVFYADGTTVALASRTVSGVPVTRTYTAPSGQLNVAMLSGSYSVFFQHIWVA